ncbi:DUF2281 domain-containing protein [Thermococcus sp.]|uniref:DUF2281 domain-containing protein n=1 Tax=Thermococcus sp. TaxID=35749 RepID=UPI0026348BAD|nr:DUF2281 domain-containing protein [Thermococcus sp.]
MEDTKGLFDKLPEGLNRKAIDYIAFLLEMRAPHKRGKLKPQRKGVLRELRGKYTSVELQRKAKEWWC